MQILILGATGRTGNLVLLEALQRGHTVTALVRTPSSLDSLTSTLIATQKSNLTTVQGSPLSASDVAEAINTASAGDNHLVVISALNPRRTSDNPWAAPHPTDSPPRMMTDSIANVLASLRNTYAGGTEQPKVMHVSALGVGSSRSQAHWSLRGVVTHSNVKLAYADHEAVEAELGGAGQAVRWVSVRPGRLTAGDDGREARVWPAEGGVVGLMAKVSRGAVARFLLDAAESSEWDGKAPVILS